MTDPEKAPTVADVPQGTVSEVLDWVGDSLARCDLAIDAESAGKQRGTLLASLTSLRKALAEGTPDGVDAAQAERDNPPCPEHFPGGWGADVITRTELVTGVRQPSVTCEHGTYKRSR